MDLYVNGHTFSAPPEFEAVVLSHYFLQRDHGKHLESSLKFPDVGKRRMNPL
jgi:hypothetical protein